MKIIEIAFVAYPITDLKRARAFYEGVLGLTPTHVFGNDEQAWIEYDIGPGTLAIGNPDSGWKPSDNGPTVGLEVDDFDAAIADLRAANVKLRMEPFETPVCRMAIIADPDGNAITMHKRKAR